MPSAALISVPFTIQVTPDAMRAALILQDGTAGNSIPPTQILDALRLEKVVVDAAVQGRVNDFIRLAESGKLPAGPFVVSEGTPAVPGVDECVVWDEALTTAAKVWQGDEPTNPFPIHHIVAVSAGARLGSLHPATPVQEGVDVRSAALKVDRTPARITIDASIRRDPVDSPDLYAGVEGKIVFADSAVAIEPLEHFSHRPAPPTGPMQTERALWVADGVPDRAELRSARTVTVCGVVEAAKVLAGEDVVVRGGIVGRNAGLVAAGGSIYTRFATGADLLARGEIHVIAEITNGRTWTESSLRGPNASVVGGCVYARSGGELSVLGNDAFAPTRIFLGASPLELAEAQAIVERVSKAKQTIQYTRDRVQPLLSNLRRLTPAQREQATELIYKAEEAEVKLAEDEQRRESLLSGPAPKLVVRERIFPGTTIGIHSRTVAFRKEMTGPLSLELRKIKNATEFVAIDLRTQAVQLLPARDEPVADLVLEFKPLAQLQRNAGTPTTGEAPC